MGLEFQSSEGDSTLGCSERVPSVVGNLHTEVSNWVIVWKKRITYFLSRYHSGHVLDINMVFLLGFHFFHLTPP